MPKCRFESYSLKEAYDALCDKLGVGELIGSDTYRVSHAGCGDTRRRLYFTSCYEHGVSLVKAYCHNCRLGEVMEIGEIPPGSGLSFELRADEKAIPMFPGDREAPTEAVRAFFGQFGLVPCDLNASWSPSLGRIVIPIYDHTKYLGYLARAMPGTPRSVPKWLTARGPEPLRTWYQQSGPGTRIVFTEDVISAAVAAKADPGSVGVPLFGLNIQPEYILQRMKDFPGYGPVVWLDNDEPSIQPRQRLTAVLRAFGYKPDEVATLNEPKYLAHGVVRARLSLNMGSGE